MLKHGIINPALAELLCRFRHTNTLVVADRNFPSWPDVETVDISLDDDIPTVRQVLQSLTRYYVIAGAFMAREFKREREGKLARFQGLLAGARIEFEPHIQFKKRVPGAIGLIRTGDTTPYSNIVLVSG